MQYSSESEIRSEQLLSNSGGLIWPSQAAAAEYVVDLIIALACLAVSVGAFRACKAGDSFVSHRSGRDLYSLNPTLTALCSRYNGSEAARNTPDRAVFRKRWRHGAFLPRQDCSCNVQVVSTGIETAL